MNTTIQEEISDLREYLNGLPPEMRDGGAVDSYQRRMEELKKLSRAPESLNLDRKVMKIQTRQ